jgi:copper transport protein
VLAHAVLIRAIPASAQTLEQAPTEVRLLFSEPLDPAFSGVRVVSASNEVVDRGDGKVDPNDDRQLVATLTPVLPNGVYVVLWRSFSTIDVHPDEGRYPLYVGVPVPAYAAALTIQSQNSGTPETAVARWLFYVSASLFAGVLFAWKGFISQALAKADDATRARVRRRIYCVVTLGAVVFLAGTMYAALAQAAAGANVPIWDALGQPTSDLLLRGRFASIWWPRLLLQITASVVLVFGGIDGTPADVGMAMLPAVLLTTSLTSHGAAAPPSAALGIGIDWLHVLSATAWVGGLIGLAVAAPALRRAASGGVADLVNAFSRYALIAVSLLALSGVVHAIIEVGSWSALVSTTYGVLVVVKLGLLAAMLALAVVNRRVRGDRGIRAELALGVLVLAVAAVLTGTPPARGTSAPTNTQAAAPLWWNGIWP